MLTYWLGQKAPLHAQQMLQILSVYVEMRHKGFFWGGGEREVWHVWDSKQIVVHKNVRHRLEKWRRGEGKMTDWQREGPLSAFSTYVCWPLSDRQDFWLQPWVAAVRNCVWQMTQHLKTQSSDSLRTATNHVRYSFCQPQPGQSFTNGLKCLFESFSVTLRRTIAELKDAITWQVRGKHDSKKNIPATSFFFFLGWDRTVLWWQSPFSSTGLTT